MTYDWDYNISTVKDADEFARFLVEELKVEYNPGDDFSTYTDANGDPLFDEFDADLYNHISMDCFNVCDKEDIDFMDLIYAHEESL